MNNFPKFTKHIILPCKKESKFSWVVPCMAIVLQFGVGCDSFCPIFGVCVCVCVCGKKKKTYILQVVYGLRVFVCVCVCAICTQSKCIHDVCTYRKLGNFRVKKFTCDKFSC